MLRPERMSKVSVAGSKRVLESTIEATHEMGLLHLSEYDESWPEFDLGRSLAGAEEVNEKLVTVRSLENMLGVDAEDVDERIVIDETALDEELESLRAQVNDLDDRRGELRTRRRELDEEIAAVEPLVDLGIAIDLLGGYDSLAVSVGEGDREAVEAALDDSEAVDVFEVMSAGRTHAVFAKPEADADGDVLADALVGIEFATLSIPDAEGSPEAYIEELQAEKASVESDLEAIEADLDEIRAEQAGFLLSAEEHLSIEAQKKEAPLSFATTDNAFVAEGWIPTDRFEEFESSLTAAVDGPLDIDEIKQAQFKSNGDHHVEDTDQSPAGGDSPAVEEPAAADGSGEPEEARADGGVVTVDDQPPVVQDNPRGSGVFEVLVGAVAKPKYSEFDPTFLVFLTFPLMFGFMIGDVGFGLLYMLIGYYLYANYDGGLSDIGGVAIWAGGFTAFFGILYDEVFGLHPLSEPMSTYLGLPVLHKGLKPEYAEWALAWFVVSVLIGVVHLNIGYILSFVEDFEIHGFKEALLESGSWILMLNGFWIFVFSDLFAGAKPEFLFTAFSGAPFPFGFEGFPVLFGWVGLAITGVGLVLLALGSLIEAVEFLNILVNVLSYTRIAAVLLAKAGTAFAVNLIVFGAYNEGGNYHFIFLSDGVPEGAEVMFGGLMPGGTLGIIGGLLVLFVGHSAVLALGVTSAGLQAVRLEYVEFFGKFYEGGGRAYLPFGYDRTYTTTDE
ncbi:MAG: V-type ATP synthase subunit I, partial [Halohasta sp.]